MFCFVHVLLAAFAVTSAAEIAVASVQRVDTGDISISPQGLYFCTDVTRDCTAGWNLPDALRQLQEKAAHIPTMGCLPYQPDITGQRTPDQLCSGRCSDAQPYASQGKFSFKQISNILAAQQHIRQYGSVVSSFDVYDDLKPFFAVKGNVKKVYRPGKTARLAFGHAVVLVGYNNDEQYWIVQNSWGNWADGGYFKVRVGLTQMTFMVYPQKPPPGVVMLAAFKRGKWGLCQAMAAQGVFQFTA